jgi:hypothetical protein
VRGLKGLSRLLAVALSIATLMLMAAVGAAAATGTLGSSGSVAAVVTASDNNGKHKGECHPPKKTHKHGTPGHKHHPCGNDGDGSD